MTITVSSAVSYTLAAAEDNLILTGAANINGNGNALANKIDGNTGANLIKGLGQADILSGFDGNDTIYAGDVGSVDALYVDTLYGGNGADVLYADGQDYLYGDADNDILHGEFGGNNLLQGGVGNDSYYVSANNSIINELPGAQHAIEVAPDAAGLAFVQQGGCTRTSLPSVVVLHRLVGPVKVMAVEVAK
jgi:Ca2+-binding RTX toxin-like protein